MLFEPTPSPEPTGDLGDVVSKFVETDKNSTVADWLIGAPLRVAIIIVVGLLVLLILRRTIRTITNHLVAGPKTAKGARLMKSTPLVQQRRAGRARTLGSVLRSSANILIGSIITLMVLDQFDISLAPLLASAGVAGVALGFGAQSLVKDFLSGIFLLLEDQYGVGDMVTFGDVEGIVEEVALRVTKVQGWDGTLWYLRNGEIISTGNQSQGWARVLVDIRVGYEEDMAQVRALLEQACAEVAADPAINPDLVAPPIIWAIGDLTENSALFQIFAKSKPGQQWEIARQVRTAALHALTEAKVPLVGILRGPASVGE